MPDKEKVLKIHFVSFILEFIHNSKILDKLIDFLNALVCSMLEVGIYTLLGDSRKG